MAQHKPICCENAVKRQPKKNIEYIIFQIYLRSSVSDLLKHVQVQIPSEVESFESNALESSST